MFYKDMDRCELSTRSRQLMFRVSRRPLRHFFGEYDEKGAWGVGQAGCLSMVFEASDVVQVEGLLRQRVPAFQLSG